MSSRSSGGRVRRTWPQRLLISFNVMAIFAALGTAGAVAWGKDTWSEVPRIQLRTDEFKPASDLPPGDPVNFLIVGTDDATGLAPDDPLLRGRDSVEGTRSDVIMVVRLDPKAETASIVSFPRDLWVEIPGHGRGRINSAVAYDGGKPDLLISTLSTNFGITVNHYLQVNFAAFKSIVNHIGGVKVYLSHPLKDTESGLLQLTAGCIELDQHQALAYARSRYLQWQGANGRWRYDPTGDLGRIKRQQDFVRRTIGQAISRGARNPATLARIVQTGVEHVSLDGSTTPQDLIDLGRAFDTFEPTDLITIEIPVVDAFRGGAEVLDPIEPATTELLATFRGQAAPAPGDLDPATITVRVANGTQRPGEGALVTDRFDAVGFRVVDPRDAPEPVWRTVVSYHPGEEAQARFVARFLDGDPVLQADATQVGEILVTTGPDLRGVLDIPRAATPLDTIETTTTTAAPTTTAAITTTTVSATPTPADAPYVAGEVPAGRDC